MRQEGLVNRGRWFFCLPQKTTRLGKVSRGVFTAAMPCSTPPCPSPWCPPQARPNPRVTKCRAETVRCRWAMQGRRWVKRTGSDTGAGATEITGGREKQGKELRLGKEEKESVEEQGLVMFLIVLISHIIQDQLLTLELRHEIGLKGWCVTTWRFASVLHFQASVDGHQICPLRCDYFPLDTAFLKPSVVTDS